MGCRPVWARPRWSMPWATSAPHGGPGFDQTSPIRKCTHGHEAKCKRLFALLAARTGRTMGTVPSGLELQGNATRPLSTGSEVPETIRFGGTEPGADVKLGTGAGWPRRDGRRVGRCGSGQAAPSDGGPPQSVRSGLGPFDGVLGKLLHDRLEFGHGLVVTEGSAQPFAGDPPVGRAVVEVH